MKRKGIGFVEGIITFAILVLICAALLSSAKAADIADIATHHFDAAVAIGDVDTGTAVGVDTNGNLKVIDANSANGITCTFVRKESSGNVTNGTYNYLANFTAKTQLKQVAIRFTNASTETVTMSFDSKTGPTYDTMLFNETLANESNLWYDPTNVVLEAGDQIAVNMTGTENNTVRVTALGETLN